MGHSSMLIAEATTLHHGMVLATSLGIQDLIIEGENLHVNNAINNGWSVPWKIANIIAASPVLMNQYRFIRVRHVYREANRATDWIVNVGLLVSSTFEIIDNVHSSFSPILLFDALGISLERRGT